MADNSDRPLPGLRITEAQLIRSIEKNVPLLKRGLQLHERLCEAMDAQEAAREQAILAAKAGGETPAFAPTDEEKAWEHYHERALTGIAIHHQSVLQHFGLDPRRSALFSDYPQLMVMACDPQVPIVYDPEDRRVSLIEMWGPAVRTISYCPYSGRKLPSDLADVRCDLIDELMDTDDWTTDQARKTLDPDFFSEAWWIKRGL